MGAGRVTVSTNPLRIYAKFRGMGLQPSHGTFDIFDAALEAAFLLEAIFDIDDQIPLKGIINHQAAVYIYVFGAHRPAAPMDDDQGRTEPGTAEIQRIGNVQHTRGTPVTIGDVVGESDGFRGLRKCAETCHGKGKNKEFGSIHIFQVNRGYRISSRRAACCYGQK